jgi:hypothetical protein
MNSINIGLKVAFAVFLITLAFASGSAIADDPGKGAVRQACQADYKTFCTGVQPGGGRIVACLQQNFDKLSPGCQQALTAAKGRQASPQAQ